MSARPEGASKPTRTGTFIRFVEGAALPRLIWSVTTR